MYVKNLKWEKSLQVSQRRCKITTNISYLQIFPQKNNKKRGSMLIASQVVGLSPSRLIALSPHHL
jgi:hypothetical protein